MNENDHSQYRHVSSLFDPSDPTGSNAESQFIANPAYAAEHRTLNLGTRCMVGEAPKGPCFKDIRVTLQRFKRPSGDLACTVTFMCHISMNAAGQTEGWVNYRWWVQKPYPETTITILLLNSSGGLISRASGSTIVQCEDANRLFTFGWAISPHEYDIVSRAEFDSTGKFYKCGGH